MFDLLIKNGRLVDGTGNPWRWADVGIKGGRIVSIGRTLPQDADEVVDARGRIVCPGFIDMHSHSDLMLFVEPEAQQKVRQGITTEVLCQDGLSVAPIDSDTLPYFQRRVSGLLGEPPVEWSRRTYGQYLDALERTKTATNVVGLVPFGNIRAQVVGLEDRPATPDEIEKMRDLVKQSMDEGGVGVSAGLIYPPNSFASQAELSAVLEAAADRGFFVVHIRNESHLVVEALQEAIAITRGAMLPLHISHFKATGQARQGQADAVHGGRNALYPPRRDVRPVSLRRRGHDARRHRSAVGPRWRREPTSIPAGRPGDQRPYRGRYRRGTSFLPQHRSYSRL